MTRGANNPKSPKRNKIDPKPNRIWFGPLRKISDKNAVTKANEQMIISAVTNCFIIIGNIPNDSLGSFLEC